MLSGRSYCPKIKLSLIGIFNKLYILLMFDFSTVNAFSHRHCIEICAFLVPANLLATLQTIIFTGIKRSQLQVRLGAAVGSFYALIMILHVFTWLAIGVVMAPTYILFLLGSICLGTNIWAAVHSSSMSRLVGYVLSVFREKGKGKLRMQALKIKSVMGNE